MSDLTKKDVKEAVVEALEGSFRGLFDKSFEPFAKGIQKDLGELKSDVGTLKSDVGTLKSDVGTLKSDVAGINIRLVSVEKNVKEMKENSSELFTKIDGFIALYKSQEEQMTVFAKQMQRFEEKLSKLEITPLH